MKIPYTSSCLTAFLAVFFVPPPWHLPIGCTVGLMLVISLLFSKYEHASFTIKKHYVGLGIFFALSAGLISLIRIIGWGGFDISWYTQVVYNILHSGIPTVTIGDVPNHLGQHFEPILYVVAIFAAVLPLPIYISLMLSQMVAALILLYVSTKKPLEHAVLEQREGMFFAVLALAFWGMLAAQNFEFHSVTVGAYLGCSAILAYFYGYKRWALILAALALGSGEMLLFSIPIILITLYISVKKSFSALKIVSILGGAVAASGFYVFAYAQWLAPFIRGDGHVHGQLNRFSALGRSFPEILLSPVSKPLVFFSTIFQPQKWAFIGCCLLIVLPPLIGWAVARMAKLKSTGYAGPINPVVLISGSLLALIGPFAKTLISNAPSLSSLNYHYGADVLPALFLLAIAVYLLLAKTLKTRYLINLVGKKNFLYLSLLIVSMPFTADLYRGLSAFWDIEEVFPPELRTALREIPVSASVSTNNLAFSAELAARPIIYSSFSRVSKDHMPDYFVLGWPVKHGYNQPRTDDIHKSFEYVEGQDNYYRSLYLGNNTLYHLRKILPGKIPAGAWMLVKIDE